jgi:hypothetical protein
MMPALQLRYKGYFSPYIQDKIERPGENRFGEMITEEHISPEEREAGLLFP